jgi:transcription elongation factor Elf1
MFHCEFCGEEIHLGALCAIHKLEEKLDKLFCNICGAPIKDKLSFMPKDSDFLLVMGYSCSACGYKYKIDVSELHNLIYKSYAPPEDLV